MSERAAVASLANNIRKLPLPLAFANHGFISSGNAGRKAARAANLRMRPRHIVGRAQIRTVRHIHAASRPDQNRIVARRFARHSILNRRPAAGAGAMPRNERFGRRQFRVIKSRALIRTAENRQHLPLNFYGCHIILLVTPALCTISAAGIFNEYF